jgi:CheY-like chemotaxis protein
MRDDRAERDKNAGRDMRKYAEYMRNQVRELCTRFLSSLGHKTASARDGQEALSTLRREWFDVALVDLRLPKLDGLQLVKIIKAEKPSPEVVILTGYGSISSAVEAMRCGAFHYLAKPFSVDGLLVENTQEAWENSIAQLIEDEELRDRLRRGARELFLQAHTLDATICSWYQLLWRIARHREERGFSGSRPQLRSAPAARSRAIAAAAPPGGLYASRPLAGARFYTFVPEADGWNELEVMLGLHQRNAAGKLVLTIYADAEVDRSLRRVVQDLSEAADNCLFRFTFPPIANSRGRRMRLRFDLEDPGPGTTVSLYEQGRPARSLFSRARRRLSTRGETLFCRLGFER